MCLDVGFDVFFVIKCFVIFFKGVDVFFIVCGFRVFIDELFDFFYCYVSFLYCFFDFDVCNVLCVNDVCLRLVVMMRVWDGRRFGVVVRFC